MKLIVDRFEINDSTGEEFVVCEGEERRLFAIPRSEAPSGVRAGDVLVIDEEGNLTKDEKATAERKALRAGRRNGGKKQ